MGELKKTSRSSEDVMGHLELVLLNRLDFSKKSSDKLVGKMFSYATNCLKLSWKCSLLSPLVNKASDEYLTCTIPYFALAERVYIDKAKRAADLAEEIKGEQKILSYRAVSVGSRSSNSSYAYFTYFFKLFKYVESFIEKLNELEPQINESEEDMSVMISLIDNNKEQTSRMKTKTKEILWRAIKTGFC